MRAGALRARQVGYAVGVLVLVVAVWELVKYFVPERGVSIGDTRILPRTSDAALPHVWSVITVLGDKDGAGTVGGTLLRTAGFTFGLALLALAIGTVVGIA